MSAALVIAEHDGNVIAPATGNVIGAAAAIGLDRIDIVVVGAKTRELADQASYLARIDRVLALERSENAPYQAAIWAPQIAAMAAAYSHILAPATTFGKDLLPRVAALLGVGMLSDITGVISTHEFLRPVYAGNAVIRVAADPAQTLCATVRPTAFPTLDGGTQAPIEPVAADVVLPVHTRVVELRPGNRQGPDLQSASRVVAAGRGIGSRDNFGLIEQLAATLDAAIGASRAAVDAGWASNDMQIGQTGKIIAPSLYIAVGISGAIQHLTGIKDADTVVAINSDAEAAICRAADLVLVADLFSAVPELIAGLRHRRDH